MTSEKPKQSKVTDLINALNAKSESGTPSISIKRTSSAGSPPLRNGGPRHREAASSLEDKPPLLGPNGSPLRNGLASHSLGRSAALRVSNVSSVTFTSDESSDDEGVIVAGPDVGKQMTRSLGRAAKMVVVSPERGSAKVAPGGPNEVDLRRKTAHAQLNGIDNEKSKSLGNSPDHVITKGNKIESNPFFLQDRLSKARLSISEVSSERRSSASDSTPSTLPHTKSESAVTFRAGPTLKQPCRVDHDLDENDLLSRSSSSSAGSTPHASPRKRRGTGIEPRSVQLRIKMWAKKEKEAEQINEEQQKIERRKSTPIPFSNRSPSRHRVALKRSPNSSVKLNSGSVDNIVSSTTAEDDDTLGDVMSLAILSPKTVTKVENIYETIPALQNSMGVEELQFVDPLELFSKQPDEDLSASVNGGRPVKSSPTRSSKKGGSDAKMSLSKWALANIFRSPRLGRKKKADSFEDKEDSLSQSDSKLKKIASRNSKKKKAGRKNLRLNVEEPASPLLVGAGEDANENQSETGSEESSPLHSVTKPRSNSVIPNTSPVVLRKLRTASDPPKPLDSMIQPSSDPPPEPHSTADDECSKPVKISVTSEDGDEEGLYGDVVTKLPAIRVNRARAGGRDRTLSREIREFMSDGFGNIGEDRKYSITPPLEHSESLLKSPFLSMPRDMKPSYSDPTLNILGSAGFSPVELSDSSSDDQSTPASGGQSGPYMDTLTGTVWAT